jgi:hypothetical protein
MNRLRALAFASAGLLGAVVCGAVMAYHRRARPHPDGVAAVIPR